MTATNALIFAATTLPSLITFGVAFVVTRWLLRRGIR